MKCHLLALTICSVERIPYCWSNQCCKCSSFRVKISGSMDKKRRRRRGLEREPRGHSPSSFVLNPQGFQLGLVLCFRLSRLADASRPSRPFWLTSTPVTSIHDEFAVDAGIALINDPADQMEQHDITDLQQLILQETKFFLSLFIENVCPRCSFKGITRNPPSVC